MSQCMIPFLIKKKKTGIKVRIMLSLWALQNQALGHIGLGVTVCQALL